MQLTVIITVKQIAQTQLGVLGCHQSVYSSPGAHLLQKPQTPIVKPYQLNVSQMGHIVLREMLVALT